MLDATRYCERKKNCFFFNLKLSSMTDLISETICIYRSYEEYSLIGPRMNKKLKTRRKKQPALSFATAIPLG